ncbi:MAG: MFS transporter [Solobacterium sp.]|nr:MFS transporter [Solobacterium sp.]
MNEEKKYLKLKDKLFYGMGDFASNIFSVLVGSFVMVYMTTEMGMDGRIIGTLMLISKILDGVSDIIFGNLIDRTHSKMGKARPWMFWSTFPLGLLTILSFMIPDIGPTAQYAYFTICYILFNAVCYTMNNIAYSTLSALITKNNNERVQLGTFRYVFAFASIMLVSGFTLQTANAIGWQKTAIIFSLAAVVINTLSCLLVRELPEEEFAEERREQEAAKEQNVKLIDSLGILVKNKFYLRVLGIYICFYFATGILGGIGSYFTQYSLGNPGLMGPLSIANNMPTIIGLFAVPFIVQKFGIYKTNLTGMWLNVLIGIPLIWAGLTGNITILVVCIALCTMCSASLMGTMNAVIAQIAAFVYKRDNLRLEGSMFSCSSMGIKLGGGLGSAVCGWLVALLGFDHSSAVQSAAFNSGISIAYCVLPVIMFAIIALLLRGLNVEKAIADLDDQTS